MGLFDGIIKGVVRASRSIGGKIVKGIKSAGEKVVKGVKSGISKVKEFITGKKAPAPPKEKTLSQQLRERGAFKPPAKPKVPYEPPIKVKNPRPIIDKGRALNDPVMTRRPSGFYGESI